MKGGRGEDRKDTGELAGVRGSPFLFFDGGAWGGDRAFRGKVWTVCYVEII